MRSPAPTTRCWPSPPPATPPTASTSSPRGSSRSGPGWWRRRRPRPCCCIAACPTSAPATSRSRPACGPTPPRSACAAGRFGCLAADAAAEHPDAVVAADERTLVLELNAMLRERHLAPLIETVADRSRRARRALWRSATDQLVGAFLRAGRGVRSTRGGLPAGRRSWPAASRRCVLDVRIDRHAGHPMHVRDGCCLYYRLPDGPHCLSCPLLDEAERARRVAAERSPDGA